MIIIITKGGEGSGNFGHAGRPGQVGGSAPDSDGQQDKRSVKEAVAIDEELNGTDLAANAQKALELADKVHGLPAGKSAKIVELKPIFPAQGMYFSMRKELAVKKLNPSNLPDEARQASHVATVLHEKGHWLDHEVLGDGKQKWTESKDGKEFVAAAMKTNEMKSLPKTQHAAYLKKPGEIFARAYMQWVCGQTGFTKAISTARLWGAGSQWSDSDFGPIHNRMTDLFVKKGLMK